MKRVFCALTALGSIAAMASESRLNLDSALFANPPAECRPRCWWHWMNGNVSKEGIARDLARMAEAGIGGATIFDLGGGIVAGPVAGYSPAWYDHLRFAGEEAAKRGIELAVHNCAGWTSSGAPWITPENSMKRLMTSEIVLEPGQAFKGRFPVTGTVPKGWIEEISLIAYAAPAAEKPAPPAVAFVRDDAKRYVLALPKAYDVTGFEFRHKPNTVWEWMRTAFFKVEASDDGATWRPVADLKLELFNNGFPLAREERLAVPLGREVRARHFRFAFDAPNDVGNRYELAELVLTCNSKVVPDVKARSIAFRQGFAPIPDVAGAAIDAQAEYLDVSKFLKPDGVFEWTAPKTGRLWIVQRTAGVSTGATNGPSPDGREGLECDKLDKKGIDAIWAGYVGKLKGWKGFKEVLCDSWEVGSQNWTAILPAEFAKRRGYRVDRFWPAFSGRVVGTREATEKFFRDWRKTIAELFTENYSDRFRDLAHRDGFRYMCEPYGNAPCDNYAYARSADLPMSEFWVHEPETYASGAQIDENSYPDDRCIRTVASTVHFHGKAFADAESFTCAPHNGGKWQKGLAIHKACGDAALASGINRFTYHSLTHQPWLGKYPPGATMNVFGTIAEINSPMWPWMKCMVAYHTRLHYALSRGRSASRLLYVAPDDQLAAFPKNGFAPGIAYDVVGADDAARVTIENGRVFAPSGAEYEAIVLAEDAAYEYASAAEVERFKRAGAKIFRDGEKDFAGVTRDFLYSGTPARVRAIRRDYADGASGFFVACPDTNAVTLACSFAVTGRFPELWDAETGKRFRIADCREEGGRTRVDLHLDPCGSAFVYFAPKQNTALPVYNPSPVRPSGLQNLKTLSRFTLTFPDGWDCGGPFKLDGPVSWTTLPGEAKYFSGVAAYETSFEWTPAASGRVFLDLGDVRETAEVFLNGRSVGMLWKPPYRLDVTDALREIGKTGNRAVSLRIDVANSWANRLIGDAKKPDDCVWWEEDWKAGLLKEIPAWVKEGKPSPTGRHTFSIVRHYKGGEPLLPAGLLGPVRLVTPFVKTPPFLQDAGTDHFAVVLETAAEDGALTLEVREEARPQAGARRVPFVFAKCPFADSFKAVASAAGLKEGTAYAWRVLRGDVAVGRGAFTTWRSSEDDFSCGVWGDYQTGLTPTDWELDKYLAGEMMFRDMLARKLDFAVTTGDMADQGLYEQEMRPLILDRTCGVLGAKIPFFTAWGNHDTRFPQNHFFLHNPKGEGGSFAFFRNGCLFICLDHADMGDDKTPGSPAMHAWLGRVLETPEAKRARFKFAFQHVPVYVEEFGNCNRWVLDLYLRHGVDLVFSGDHHGYNRIERGGILQIVNGCFGYFGKRDDFVNWYGDEVKAGGHKGMPDAPKWRRQAPGRPGVLDEPTSVGQGLFPGYGVLSVRGDEATWTEHVFNADGSYAGVADAITVKSRRGRAPRAIPPLGMSTEYFCFSKPDDPRNALKYTLTGKGGAQLELVDFGARVVGFRVPDGKGGYDVKTAAPKTFRECLGRWPDSESFRGEAFHEGDVVGVRFYRKGELVKTVTLLPDNTWRATGNGD